MTSLLSPATELQPEVRPQISVIVVVYNIPREAPRTLYSLSAAYQQNIAAEDYEVIVVDNGSTPRLDPSVLDGLEGNFRIIRIDPASPSPAHAINVGLAAARSDVIGVMIDGARIVTPGFLHFARAGSRMFPRPVIVSLGYYLGFDIQCWSIESGYDQVREDALLDSIGWPADGYRLFEISALDESSLLSWFSLVPESNGMFLTRNMWNELGGFDERFDFAGGGLVNLDATRRACELPNAELVVLLGEGTFHQLHGGVATNADYRTFPEKIIRWIEQYEAISGRLWSAPVPASRSYIGRLPPPVLAHFAQAIIEPIAGESAVGHSFDKHLWTFGPGPQPADRITAALLELAEAECRAHRFEAGINVARLARTRSPHEMAVLRLLRALGAWGRDLGEPPAERRAGFHLARGKAFRLIGDNAKAAAEFYAGLAADADLVEAHVALAELRLPGEGYHSWLRRFHELLRPEFYLEIGVADGASLSLAQPPTCAVGIDPDPKIVSPLLTDTHIFRRTSDDLFSEDHLARLLGQRRLGLAFIDGAHVFAQALRDFRNVEKFCNERSVILFHDTLPLDEVTQRPERQRRFYTGDVWKTIVCLRYYRPDLDIFTIATPLSGLTVVARLDPNSRILHDRYEEAIAQFNTLQYSDYESRFEEALNVVANDWSLVESHLRMLGIV